MGVDPTKALKVSLWLEAALLLILTSLLADTNAWGGAILSAAGLCFAIVGITAAHKRRLGFLYCYATLMGVWELLALAHILIICGLISFPGGSVGSDVMLGPILARNGSDPLRIAIPVLYGFQWCAWCISLVCLVSLRLAVLDPTLDFEIQDPKRPHSLEGSRSQTSDPRMSQHLFNFRQSVISPIGAANGSSGRPGSGGGTGMGEGGPSGSKHTQHKGKETMMSRQQPGQTEMPRAPAKTWSGVDRSSSESNAIYIPNDPRISQVVVTFRDGEVSDHVAAPVSIQAPKVSHSKSEPTTIYITNHNYGNNEKARDSRFVLDFATSGESLSDMIFKSSEAGPSSIGHPTMQQDAAKRRSMDQESNKAMTPMPNPARIRGTATKASLTLSSDSSSSQLSVLSDTTSFVTEDPRSTAPAPTELVSNLGGSSEASDRHASETIVMGLAMAAPGAVAMASTDPRSIPTATQNEDKHSLTSTTSSDTTPESILKRFSYPPRDSQPFQFRPRRTFDNEEGEFDLHSISPDAGQLGMSNFDMMDESHPGMQPNSSDSSHSLSSTSTSSILSKGQETSAPHSGHRCSYGLSGTSDDISMSASISASTPVSASAFASESTSVSASTTFRTNPASSSELASCPLPAPSPISATTATTASTASASGRTKTSLASLPLQYWRNRTHATDSSISSTPSFTQNLTHTFSKKKKIQIPTIVLHPDEEDGEPPRVLSQKDIEYLSTMPPAPLRHLVQPWDDIPEEENEEDMINEGYDYDDYHPGAYDHHPHDGLEYEHESDDQGPEGDFSTGEYDPYALDVPIDLELDLQGLEQGDVKGGYGYI